MGKWTLTLLTLGLLGLAASAASPPPDAPAGSISAVPPGQAARVDAKDPNVLLADTFEDGISTAWASVSKGIQSVPEDPNRPAGNHVARMTEFRQTLHSLPIRKGSIQECDRDPNLREAYRDWENYEFSFRFRLGRVEDQPYKPGNVGTFLNIHWREHPAEDNPSETQLAFIQAWRHSDKWRMSGPLVAWYGANRGYEVKGINQIHPAAIEGVALDTGWHRVGVRCQGERVRIYWDGKLFFDGCDDRVLDGAVSISYWWDGATYKRAAIDVDDVIVRRLPLTDPEDAGGAAAGGQADLPKAPELAIAMKAAKPPKIDGKLDDAVWAAAMKQPEARLGDWVTVGDRPRPASGGRSAWLAYDEKFLYVAFRAAAADPNALAAYENEAKPGDSLRADFAGAACGIDCKGRNVKIILPYVIPTTQAVRVEGGYWTAEMAIPWSDVGGKPKPGTAIPFNLAGTDSSDGPVSWSHVRDFRDVKGFAKLRLAK